MGLRPVIPVAQRQLYVAGEQAGDCWKCCLASILELPYEDVPHFIEVAGDEWWNATLEWMRPRGFTIARFGLWGQSEPKLIFGSRKIGYHFSSPGHWIGGVTSPRVDADGNNIGHVVVMSGSAVVFDPHPERDKGHGGFDEAFLLVAA